MNTIVTDLYGHRETSVREGREHLTGGQQHGGQHRVRSALDAAGINYGPRETLK